MKRRTVLIVLSRWRGVWTAATPHVEATSPVSATLAARECAARELGIAEADVELDPVSRHLLRARRAQTVWAWLGALALRAAAGVSLALACAVAVLWLMDGRAQ